MKVSGGGLLAGVLLVTGSVGAAPALLERPLAELKIDRVTVFSDRARVVRSGKIEVPRGGELVLPRLPASVDPASVRVDAKGATVQRVEVRRTERAELPRSEALTLVETIERLEREGRELEERLTVLNEERRFVQTIGLKASPVTGDVVSTFEPSGWAASLGFLDARDRAALTALAPIETALLAKNRELETARERAAQLLAGNNAQPGWEVMAEVSGSGNATLELTYVAMNARWYPTYDVRFDPDAQQVALGFSGLVSQQTGEDWADAQLTLSTAVPSVTSTMPRLTVWKIGDRERFIPTPQAKPEPRPPLPPPWRPQPLVSADEDELREKLQQALQGPLGGRATGTTQFVPGRVAPQESARGYAKSSSPPPPPPAPRAEPQQRISRSMDMSTAEVTGSFFDSEDEYVPTEGVSFAGPGAYRRPSYAADLPAALAGGYTFTYDSARRESVASGAQAVKVALHSATLPAKGVVRLLPALSPQAFLVAEVTNTTDKPLLAGKATLFVGNDLVGEGKVPNTAKGAKTTLPLGVDDAISVERHVEPVASEEGIFSRDDVTTYDVKIQLLNPRPKSVKAVVVEQVPVAKGEHVEVKLLSANPKPARGPDADGLIEWELELPRGEKKTVTFRYSFKRPKDWEPYQFSQPKGGR